MTQIHVYRGVRYLKQADKLRPVKRPRTAKIYRGARYFQLPKFKHEVTDHVYRGHHYMA